jgi:hypothetical protein
MWVLENISTFSILTWYLHLRLVAADGSCGPVETLLVHRGRGLPNQLW